MQKIIVVILASSATPPGVTQSIRPLGGAIVSFPYVTVSDNCPRLPPPLFIFFLLSLHLQYYFIKRFPFSFLSHMGSLWDGGCLSSYPVSILYSLLNTKNLMGAVSLLTCFFVPLSLSPPFLSAHSPFSPLHPSTRPPSISHFQSLTRQSQPLLRHHLKGL